MTVAQTTLPAFADLIERHKETNAAWTAALERGEDNEGNRLGDEANGLLDELVAAPCSNDAALILKLRYLCEATRELTAGPPHLIHEWDVVAIAAYRHLFPGELA
jgi:hypothetical protein